MNIRDFFYLQKSDRKVIAFLLCLAVTVLGAIFLLGNKSPRTLLNAADSTAFVAEKGRKINGRATDLRTTNWKTAEKQSCSPSTPTQPTAHS